MIRTNCAEIRTNCAHKLCGMQKCCAKPLESITCANLRAFAGKKGFSQIPSHSPILYLVFFLFPFPKKKTENSKTGFATQPFCGNGSHA